LRCSSSCPERRWTFRGVNATEERMLDKFWEVRSSSWGWILPAASGHCTFQGFKLGKGKRRSSWLGL
jgi:hypothetical protein